jgi:hypothetical protein
VIRQPSQHTLDLLHTMLLRNWPKNLKRVKFRLLVVSLTIGSSSASVRVKTSTGCSLRLLT